MTDADKLRRFHQWMLLGDWKHHLEGEHGTEIAEIALRIASLLDAIPPETIAALKAGTMVVIPVGFAQFLKAVMESARDSSGCDVDVEDYATETGILVAVPVTEPCGEGENCVCAEYGFPTECYRYSQPFKDLRSALSAAPTKPGD